MNDQDRYPESSTASHPHARVNAERLAHRWLAPALVVVVVALTAYPLFSPLGMLNDDYPAVYLRIHQYYQEFRSGHMPATLPDVVRGGGAAFPLFYPPFSYYLGAAIYAALSNVVWAGHLTGLLSLTASALTMTWAAQRLGAPRTIAVLAGLAYATFPYRLTNVMVRGAIAESWALAWLPLVLAHAVAATRDKRSGTWLAVSAGLLLISHTGLALWALPLIALTVVLTVPRESVIRCGAAISVWLGVGAALAFWFLFPMRHYLSLVLASDPATMHATAGDFTTWRATWSQILGMATQDIQLWTGAPLAVPMTLSLGLPALVLPVAILLGLRRPTERSVPETGTTRLEHLFTIALALLLLVAVYPGLVAQWLPQPWLYLQFPYRLLGIAGLFAVIATALALGAVSNSRTRQLLGLVWAASVAVGVVLGTRQPVPVREAPQDALLATLPTWDKGLTARSEYLPREARHTEIGDLVTIARQSLQAQARSYHEATNELRVTIHLSEPTRMLLPRVAYPFLRVETSAGRAARTSTIGGLLAVELPAGTHTVAVKRRVPWPVWTGLLGSLLTAAVLARYHRRGAGVRPVR